MRRSMKVCSLHYDVNSVLKIAFIVIDYFDGLPSQRVVPTIEPGYLRPLIPENPPEEPEQWSQIQADIETKIKPGLTHWQSPNFMAFFPAGVTYPSILGEMYSAAFTAPAFNWLCSPACTELETIVMDWMAKALGLPECFLSSSLKPQRSLQLAVARSQSLRRAVHRRLKSFCFCLVKCSTHS